MDEADASTELSTRVVEAIAECAGAEPDELSPPLYTAVDLDALDGLARRGTDVTVTFRYGEYAVDVRTDGTVSVEEVDADPAGRAAA